MTELQATIKDTEDKLRNVPIDTLLSDDWRNTFKSIVVEQNHMFMRALELSMQGRIKLKEFKCGYGLIHMAFAHTPMTTGHALQILNIMNQIENIRQSERNNKDNKNATARQLPLRTL